MYSTAQRSSSSNAARAGQKRMDSRMVAHVWAQQSQPEGWNNNKQFYFEGPTIYSYGPHFPIARFTTDKNGAQCVLMTTRTRSVTTSKHISFVWSGIHRANRADLPVFKVQDVTASPQDNFASMVSQFEYELKETGQTKHTKKRDRLISEAAATIERANTFAEAFGIRKRLKMPADLSAHLARVQRAADKARKAKEIAEAARLVEARALATQHLAEWRQGLRAQISYVMGQAEMPTALRVSGDDLETTQGARIPLDQAKVLWPKLAELQKAGGADFRGSPLRPVIGQFRIDAMAPDGTITAGCHTIAWSEVEIIARELGLLT